MRLRKEVVVSSLVDDAEHGMGFSLRIVEDTIDLAWLAGILVGDATNVTIASLAVDGRTTGTDCNKNPVGIFYRNASGTVQDVAVRNMRLGPGLEGCQGGQGVFVQSSLAGSSPVSVLRSSIHGYQKNGIQIGFGAAGGVEGTGNTIRNNRINEAPIGIWNFSGTNTIPPPPPGLRNSFFNVGVAIHSGMTPPVIARLLREAGAQLAARVAGPSPIP